ncbi:MAG: hypothetical protein HQ456_09030 [Polynucleobacter sp.]|nr:hypothetical protein [Polynucleobacter sp.]
MIHVANPVANPVAILVANLVANPSLNSYKTKNFPNEQKQFIQKKMGKCPFPT